MPKRVIVDYAVFWGDGGIVRKRERSRCDRNEKKRKKKKSARTLLIR